MISDSIVKTAQANRIMLRRTGKVIVVPAGAEPKLSPHYVATVAKNLESLGYTLSLELMEACRRIELAELTQLNKELLEILSILKGADHTFRPMYPGFPQQVMDMSEGELYLNAIVHYLTDGKYLPEEPPKKLFGIFKVKGRPPLIEKTDLKAIDLCTLADFESVFTRLAGSNTAISPADKEDLIEYVKLYGDQIAPLLPQSMPNRENKIAVIAALIAHTNIGEELARQSCSTATDVLRLATGMSSQDVSLALPGKFRNFKRSERRLLLELLEAQSNLEEDMLRWHKRWIRLGERLHPGEWASKYPRAFAAFTLLRNNQPFETTNGKLERLLEHRQVKEALQMLKGRPGDLARRLDHLLRLDKEMQQDVALTFAQVASKVSTVVLLQLRHHFKTRCDKREMRVFLPKGVVAKAQAEVNCLSDLPPSICEMVTNTCTKALEERFAKLPALGRVYVDPALQNYMVPFALRSASKALRTISRGSRVPLPVATDTLRFFVWWKNGNARTDLDLSAAMFDDQFKYIDAITFYNLKNFGGHHSGDIVDAPQGASEFIDVSRARCLELNARYIVMLIKSYTMQPYCDLPECFAGWMSRQQPASGEVYEPKTVVDKLDISSDSQIAIPAIFDLVEEKVIWVDLSLTSYPCWNNTVAVNLKGIQVSLKAMVEMSKPDLYDLLSMHARARGTVVDLPGDADVVYSADDLPFDLTSIASQFMCD